MKICIPSKERAESITTHLFFDPKEVLIFVEPQEVKKYKIFHPEYTIIDIQKNDKGISYARNYILDYIDGENIVMADDDYREFKKRNKKSRYTKINNCKEIINSLEKNLDRWIISGIASEPFSYFQNIKNRNKRFYVNKQFPIDFYSLNTSWLRERNIRFDENLKEEEDADLNIMILINGGNICNDYLYCRTKTRGNTGGLYKERGTVLIKDRVISKYLGHLKKKYGYEFITFVRNKKGNVISQRIHFDLMIKKLDTIRENYRKYENERS